MCNRVPRLASVSRGSQRQQPPLPVCSGETNVQLCLLHGDLRLENIFLDESNNVSAIIDWENAFFGPPESDIARLDIAFGKFSWDYSRAYIIFYIF